MTATDVIEVLEWLEAVGVRAWVDGGWGVDALVGEQTRPHADLDLALDRDQLDVARRAVEARGFHHDGTSQPGLPARLVMRDGREREVDLHPLAFDTAGDGWQQLSASGMAWGRYPADDLGASGEIGGRPVRCLSPGLQVRFRLGYEWSERDLHDVRLLSERFGVPAPPSFRQQLERPSAPMSAERALAVLSALRGAAVAVSVEGGWGVDALLRRQTREHADIDLAVARADCERAAAALEAVGFEHDTRAWPGLPARLVLRDDEGRQVDLHPLVFDREGNGWQELAEGGWYLHPATFLWRDGTIAGRDVHCIAPELQLGFRLGYEWGADDRHDLSLLAEEFGIPLPPESR